MNPDNHDDLSSVRLKEWQTAGKLMGAHDMHYLGYKDGQLNNHSMIEITERIIDIITPIIEEASADTKIEFMTNDLNGITGHIDHIVAARAACHAFYQMKARDNRLTRIRLCCLTAQEMPNANTNWLYMEAGRPENEIDETIDARHLRDEIVDIIRTHHTQRQDGEYCIRRCGDQLGMNYFIIKT
jgi:LmbE family N-acetylglucosaminyl deacetylase